MQEVTGNLAGLSPGQQLKLERIFRRRVNPHEVVGAELAGFLAECSIDTGRQVGIMVDRRGQIEHVVVGDAHKLWLPDVGRLRAAKGRFRGLRLIHTHLRGEGITRDDLTDLALLRLDLVAAVIMGPSGGARAIEIAHLVPEAESEKGGTRTLPEVPVGRLELDFPAFMRGLEEEFARKDQAGRLVDGDRKAILVHLALGRALDSEARVAELKELARTAGIGVLDVVVQARPAADPKTLLGAGKLEQVVLRAMQLGADLLIFDQELTPGQARTIADSTELTVLDRTGLILEIFGKRATSRDGKLQVELAELRYTLPRLVEKHTMLSRLVAGGFSVKGGRGPGETKLEIARRRARERIQRLEHAIEQLAVRRRIRRHRRKKNKVPVVAIVGYTNAGKSTLLNALTHSDVVVEDKLFATLDPTSRRYRTGRLNDIIFTDTVGFIRDLPPDLVRAFRATLEELSDADLLLQVVDASDEDHEAQLTQVDRILGELGLGERPRLVVFNKIDRLPPGAGKELARQHRAMAISAQDSSTLPPLRETIDRMLAQEGAATSWGSP